MKKVLLLSLSDLTRDPRPSRMVQYFMHRNVELTTMGTGGKPSGDFEYIPLPCRQSSRSLPERFRDALPLLLHRYRAFGLDRRLHQLEDELKKRRFDTIISHDLVLLPFVFRIKNGARVILDAHEYYPKQFDD